MVTSSIKTAVYIRRYLCEVQQSCRNKSLEAIEVHGKQEQEKKNIRSFTRILSELSQENPFQKGGFASRNSLPKRSIQLSRYMIIIYDLCDDILRIYDQQITEYINR